VWDVANQRPIVCTLTPSDLRNQAGAWRKLWASGLIRRDRIAGGIRLSAEPGGVEALHKLLDLERECCSWIDYEVDASGATLTASGAGEAVLARMFAKPSS
jgi:hypothetical protein